MNYKTTIMVDGIVHDTLSDILPECGKLKILFIGKTPAPISVEIGHYFQGKQGRMFWNRLKEYGVLNVPHSHFEDEYLLSHNYGLTDIVKVPRDYGNEPSVEEYRNGFQRVVNVVKDYEPEIIIFVYKKVLDSILLHGYGINEKSQYGFNPKLDKYFKAKTFVFPMPGTPCSKMESIFAMRKLKALL